MNLGVNDYNGAFRIVNLAVAGLAVLSGLSQLFNGIISFILALYIIGSGLAIGVLEYQVPAEAYAYGSFLFSFVGRGICLIYIALEFIPSISPPENMNPEGIAIATTEEDII